MKNRFSLRVLFFCLAFLLFSQSVSVEASVSICPFMWTKNIKIGSEGEEVLKLQQFLNSFPDTVVALSGVGSLGNESTSYGLRTAKAVVKFQEKYAADTLVPVGLTKGSGFVGTLTRAKLNALCVAGVIDSSAEPDTMTVEALSPTVTESSTEDVLTVTAPEQPASTLAPAGAGAIPFTSVALTAGAKDVTVNSVVVERVGAGADGAFDSVAITDEEGNQIGVEKGLRSNHRVELGDPFVIPANTSQTIVVVANMVSDLTDFGGQMPIFQVVAINTSTAVKGPLPVRGTGHLVNSTLVIGAATTALSQFDPNVDTNRYINDKSVRFSGVRFTATSREDLTLSSITWDQSGSASNADIANIVTVVNGQFYPTTVSGRKFTSVFEPSIVITKGNSIDVHVQGDLTTTGSNRTVKFDIRKSGDIAIMGNTYNFYVLIYADSNTATSGNSVFTTSDGTTDGNEVSPFFSGSVVTINSGGFTTVGK